MAVVVSFDKSVAQVDHGWERHAILSLTAEQLRHFSESTAVEQIELSTPAHPL
jgi:hypothetical protein